MKYLYGAIMATLLGTVSADAATLNLPATIGKMLVGGGYDCDPPVIPEPATWGLMIVGFAVLALALRARRKVEA